MQSTRRRHPSEPGGEAKPRALSLPDEPGYRPGDRIADRYVLRELIGTGGMGTVWRARHEALGSDVALKITNCPNGDIASRMVREAHLCARLSHPGVVRVLDAGIAPHGESFVVMELLAGMDLATWFENLGSIPPVTALSLLLPALGALRFVHDKGIVHRDLKPENIYLVERDGGVVEPKLLDFGIAWAPDVDKLTRPGDALGTPAYMSPEQAAGLQADVVSDLWSFCVVLYEALEGKLPFEAPNAYALLFAIQHVAPTPPKFAESLPKLWQILKRGLEKDGAARWPDARSLGSALAECLEESGVHEDGCGQTLRPFWGAVETPTTPPPSAALPPDDHAVPLLLAGRRGASRWLERRWGMAAVVAAVSALTIASLSLSRRAASSVESASDSHADSAIHYEQPTKVDDMPIAAPAQRAQPEVLAEGQTPPRPPLLASGNAHGALSTTRASVTATEARPSPASAGRDPRKQLKNPFE